MATRHERYEGIATKRQISALGVIQAEGSKGHYRYHLNAMDVKSMLMRKLIALRGDGRFVILTAAGRKALSDVPDGWMGGER